MSSNYRSIKRLKVSENLLNFVDNEFLALDSRAFRKYLDEITPDIELKFDYTSQTGNLHKIDVPLGIDFFWPAAE